MNTQKVREEFDWLEETNRISRLFALAKVKWLQVKWEDDTGEHVEMLPTGSYAFWQMPSGQLVSSAKVFDIALADSAGQIALVYPDPPTMKASGLTSAKTYSRTIQHMAARGLVTPPQQGKATQWIKKPAPIGAPEKPLNVRWFDTNMAHDVKPTVAQDRLTRGIQASLPEGACVHSVTINLHTLTVFVKRNGVLVEKLTGWTPHSMDDFVYKEIPYDTTL